jgi:hypothetical protein
MASTFAEMYRLTGEILGTGAYASVQTCVNVWTDMEYAVKVIYILLPMLFSVKAVNHYHLNFVAQRAES